MKKYMTRFGRLCFLSFAFLMCMPVIAQKKYTDKDIASMKQKLATSVAGHAKDVQVMVDQIFSFGELGFQEFETSAYLTSVLSKNGFAIDKNISNVHD
jgi:aminobenzoyl-glutamate utilization protein B